MMVLTARFERVVSYILPHLSSERDAMLHRVAEMHAAVHACIDHLVDQLIRAAKSVSRAGDGTSERQANSARAEVVSCRGTGERGCVLTMALNVVRVGGEPPAVRDLEVA